jgi:hypothetical protein
MERKNMLLANNKVKFWILATLSCLLFWIIRLVPEGLVRFYNIIFVSWDYYPRIVVGGWMYSLATLGILSRLIGVTIGIAALLITWKRKSLLEIKKLIAIALCWESLYYLLLIPSPIYLIALANEAQISYAFGTAFILQIGFTAPCLAILAVKILKQGKKVRSFQLQKWSGIAFSGYIIALWANSGIRWFDMISTTGIQFFFTGINVAGALNHLILMSSAVAFSIIAVISLTKQRKTTEKWLGLSLTMVGIHYTIYAVFSYLIGNLSAIWLVDIWAIPLLGLGITILVTHKQS